MKKILLAAWLCLPVAGWAYHQGPGQERLRLDRVDAALADAAQELQGGNHDAAVQGYELALKELPADRVQEARRIRLELAKLRMEHKQLPTAQRELSELVKELSEDETASPELLAEARRSYANAQYYITYLMRLEGYTREDWEPQIEISRQMYRLLAEQADQVGDDALALASREDLESTVRLARLDLQDLQGLPLPNQ
ncbi:MAG TPA: hypothetical protein P5218_13545 [Planctomycetota bacterium]|nr:hypothetical protein [Planctomycetota bacterium]